MSHYPGGIIRAMPLIPTVTSAKGIWTLQEAMQATSQGIWPGHLMITRALRFNSADSAYANLTPAAGTQDKYKISAWVKRGNLGITATIISAASSSGDAIYFNSSDKLCWDFAGTNRLISTAVFRDPTAWYYFEFIYDAANATSAQKARVYVFRAGTLDELTAWDTDTRSSITTGTSKINTNVVHEIGRKATGTTNYFDGYISHIALVDNSVSTGFGGFVDFMTGSWNPGGVSGAKWWLKWEDNADTTSAHLGKDSGSDATGWTCNNFSVTAGVGNDSLTDTPTNYGTDTGAGGEMSGNYAMLSPIDKSDSASLSGANLTLIVSATQGFARSTVWVTSGKWYCEWTSSGTKDMVGVSDASASLNSWLGNDTHGWGYYGFTGNKFNGSGAIGYGASFGSGDVIGIAFDADTGTIEYFKDNVSQGVAFTGLTNGPYCFSFGQANTSGDVNFGQRAFAYAAPSGFKTLCTQNLPAPAIIKPSTYFDVNLRAGTGSAANITGFGFQPDLVWSKSRSSRSHMIANSVRGTGKYVSSDSTGVETSDAQSVTAFNSDGFSVGTAAIGNTNAENYVDWMLKKGAAPGFDIVQYTGTTLAQNVAHGLGVVPGMIIVKRLTTLSEAWPVYHKNGNAGATGKGGSLKLNTTAAYAADTTIWNNTDPTSSVFSVGTSVESNILGETFEAFLFASVEGFSKVGYYTGNAAANGPFVWCGFRPRFVMMKSCSTTDDWTIYNTVRDTYNVMPDRLYADTNAAEGTTSGIDILANGFKLRTITTTPNAAQTYIFIAIAERPFKYARAR